MRWCRFGALLRGLPRESLTVRAVAGESARWGEVEHLLAVVIDLLQGQMWQTSSVYSKRKPKRPRPYPRPGVVDPNRRRFGAGGMDLAEARKWLDRKRGR